jgi:hypothetical protein
LVTLFLESVIHIHRMVDDDNLIRARGYLSLQLALLEDVVDTCAMELGVDTRCLGYADRGLTAKIDSCKAEALTLTAASVDLGELPVVLDAASALSMRALKSIHDMTYGGPSEEQTLEAGHAGNTRDRMTPIFLDGLVREITAVAIRLLRWPRSKHRG